MEVSPEVAGWAGVAWNIGLPHIRSKAEQSIRDSKLEHVFEKVGFGKHAGTATNVVANTLGWGMIAAKPIEGAADVVSTYLKQRNELTDKLAPVIQAEGMSVGLNSLQRGELAKNEIVKLELDRISDRAQSRFFKDVAAASLTVIPQAVVKHREDLIRVSGAKPANAKLNAQEKAEAAKEALIEKRNLEQKAREFYQEHYVGDNPEKPIVPQSDREREQAIREIIAEFKGDQATQAKAEQARKAASEGLFSNENLINYGTPIASLVQKEMQSSNMANADKHAKEKTAFSMIMKLQDVVERDGKLDSVEGKKLSSYVKEIFETHQKNMRRSSIGERNSGDLEYASSEIAQSIARGTLHPLALIHLVGDGEIVRNNGKSIASRAEVSQSIAKMTTKMPAKYAVDPDKYLSETSFSEAEAKELVTKLPSNTRDVFLSLMPDEVKTRLGTSDAEIAQIHARVKDTLAQQMQLMVFDLASRSDDDLKAQHITDNEIKFLRKVAKDSKAKGAASVLAAVSTHGNFKDGIEFALVNDKSYWQSIAKGAQVGDAYHAANDELFTERLERERTEKLVDERARKIIEERENEREHGAPRKFADSVRQAPESHVEKVEGKGKPVNTSAETSQDQDAPSTLAGRVAQQRQSATHGHVRHV
jgi:hypothetical protein